MTLMTMTMIEGWHVRSPLRFSQFFVKRRRLGFFNNAQPWRVEYGDDYNEQNDHWSEYQKTNTLFSALSTTLGFGGLILIQKKYCS